MRKIKLRKKYIITFMLLLISVGFAYLSSNLNISGLFDFAASTWDVHFDNVQMIRNDLEADVPIIDVSKTSLTFSGEFNVPSEVYEFSVDVVNSGTIDAMLNSIVMTGITDENKSYIDYFVTYYDGASIGKKDLLKANHKVKLRVKLKYKYDIDQLPDLGEETFSLTIEYVTASKEAVDVGQNLSNGGQIIASAKANSLTDLKLFGNSKQVNYEGYQLIHKDSLSTARTDSEFWKDLSTYVTPMTDGWVKVRHTNNDNNPYLNLFIKKDMVDLKPDTDYTVFVEYRNFSDSSSKGSIVVAQPSKHDDDPFYADEASTVGIEFNMSIYEVKSVLLHTKIELTDNMCGLRSFFYIPADKYLNVEVRIMLVEGNHLNDNYTYEPYVGGVKSPSTYYPQEVENMSGDCILSFTGKNLLNYNNINYGNAYVDDEGYILNSTPTTDARPWSYDYNDFHITLPKGNYVISIDFDHQSTQGDNKIKIIDSNEKLYSTESIANINRYVKKVTLTEETNLGITIKGYDARYRIQIEAGDKATEWSPYVVKNLPINLGNIELNRTKNFKDYIYNKDGKWFIHKEIAKKIFSPDDDWNMNGGLEFIQNNEEAYLVDSSNVAEVFSNRYIKSSRYAIKVGNIAITGYKNFAILELEERRNLDWLKTFLQTNETYVIYPLKDFREIEIKDDNLINDLNNIMQDNLEEGYNFISFKSGNLNSDFSFDYTKK